MVAHGEAQFQGGGRFAFFPTYNHNGTGAFVFANSANEAATYLFIAQGTTAFSGSANEAATYPFTAHGPIDFAGAGIPQPLYLFNGSDQFNLGGVATIPLWYFGGKGQCDFDGAASSAASDFYPIIETELRITPRYQAQIVLTTYQGQVVLCPLYTGFATVQSEADTMPMNWFERGRGELVLTN